jgi:glycosyltransferase involved in cell wall biosynthesis
MKILVCVQEYPPEGSGIANVAHNIVKIWSDKGLECAVCSPTGPDIICGSQKLIKSGLFGLIHYWNKVHRLNFEDYDLVWLHNPLFIKRFVTNKPIICTMNSTYQGSSEAKTNPELYYRFASKIELHCLKNLPPQTKFTGVSQKVAGEIQSYGIDKGRIKYIPNGVDTKLFHPQKDKKRLRRILGIPEEKKILLCLGRITDQKQPLETVRLFSYLSMNCPQLHLVMVGKGDLFEKTKLYARKRGLNNVTFYGYAREEDLPKLYACADYYIILSKYEGGEPPLTLAEALSSGLPSIVSDIPNFEIVRKYNCGAVIEEEADLKYSKKIMGLLEKNRGIYSKNARKYALSIDWKKISESYLKIT